jgi:uncharacterized LabA/DUF88 family protein
MTMSARVALLIDAENISPELAQQMLKKCQSLGQLRTLRCYGGSQSLKKWEITNAEYHIVPMLTLASGTKPNASDFALTIDAVSMLHHNVFDHVLIASSDADFTQLAIHVRENGKSIHGFGVIAASENYKSAFDSFTYIPDIIPPKTTMPVKIVPKPTPVSKAPAVKPLQKAVTAVEIPNTKKLLLNAFDKHAVEGKLSLSTFGKIIRDDYPLIEVKKGKLKKMTIEIGLVVDGAFVTKKQK